MKTLAINVKERERVGKSETRALRNQVMYHVYFTGEKAGVFLRS